MTTLAANKTRAYEGVPVRIEESALPMIASDILYEGGAIGIVPASGHARPLAAGDTFGGFAARKADNSLGGAAAIRCDRYQRGYIELPVTGAVITDVGQPVFATDDDTFTFSPVGSVFVGFVHRFVSAGVVIVHFDAGMLRDPYAEYTVRETLATTKTLDIEDNGKLFVADTDNTVVTMPAVATPVHCKIVNLGRLSAASSCRSAPRLPTASRARTCPAPTTRTLRTPRRRSAAATS